MMNNSYNIDYYNYPRKYYKEKKNYELKDIKKVKEYERELIENNEIELLPNSIYEYDKNKYYNIRKKIYYDSTPLKNKYNINGGIIFDTFEYNKKILINELINNELINNEIYNNSFRYNYEDGILFKYQYITNCSLCILPKKKIKNFNYKYYNKIKINELNNNECILLSYEDFYKMISPTEYEYIEYFKNVFELGDTLNNIFHIYWKRILFLDFKENIIIKTNNIKCLKCCIKWFIIKEQNLCYTIINSILDYTINNETYNKNEYIKYFLENSIYKINEKDESNMNIIKIELNESLKKKYNLNLELNDSEINLLNYLNNNDNKMYNFKIDKCDTYENTIKNIKENNINEINNINKRIVNLENLEKKTKEEYDLLILNYEYNNLEYIENKLIYLKNDIERNNIRKDKIINQIEYINNNVKEENIKNCPICYDSIDNYYSILDCGHYFCINCSNIISNKYWFNCPNCRDKNNSFNYIIKDEIDKNQNNNIKIDIIIEYIKKYYDNIDNKNSNILIISNYKDNLRLLNKTFKKNPKCSFLDRQIKKESNIFMCNYDKLENINNNEYKEILILEPSLIKTQNELVKYKFNNINT